MIVIGTLIKIKTLQKVLKFLKTGLSPYNAIYKIVGTYELGKGITSGVPFLAQILKNTVDLGVQQTWMGMEANHFTENCFAKG